MATKKANGNNQAKPAWAFEFVSCELTDEDITGAEYLAENLSVGKVIEIFLAQGIKVSFTYDYPSGCPMVYAQPIDPASHPFGRRMLSARAPTVLLTAAALVYKHTEKLKEDWTNAKVAQSTKWR